MNIACRSTQNVARIKRLLSLHIVIKPLNKKNNKFFIMLKCNSINIHSNTLQLATGWPLCRWFWKFFSGFAKSPRVLRSSWILNECNLYFKTVKYCILSGVCMRLIVLFHLRLSDVMYKKYKRLVCTHPDLLARFYKVNLSNAKNSAWFIFQEFVFHA